MSSLRETKPERTSIFYVEQETVVEDKNISVEAQHCPEAQLHHDSEARDEGDESVEAEREYEEEEGSTGAERQLHQSSSWKKSFKTFLQPRSPASPTSVFYCDWDGTDGRENVTDGEGVSTQEYDSVAEDDSPKRLLIAKLVKTGRMFQVDAEKYAKYFDLAGSAQREALSISDAVSAAEEKKVYKFVIYQLNRFNKSKRSILQIDFDRDTVSCIQRGNIERVNAFCQLASYETEDDVQLKIQYNNQTSVLLEADSLQDKLKICRLLNEAIRKCSCLSGEGVAGSPTLLPITHAIIREGELGKMGRNLIVPVWVRRWVRLRPGELAYYRLGEQMALNLIDLSDSRVVISKEVEDKIIISCPGKKYIFRIPSSSRDPDTIEQHRDLWYQDIKRASHTKRIGTLMPFQRNPMKLNEETDYLDNYEPTRPVEEILRSKNVTEEMEISHDAMGDRGSDEEELVVEEMIMPSVNFTDSTAIRLNLGGGYVNKDIISPPPPYPDNEVGSTLPPPYKEKKGLKPQHPPPPKPSGGGFPPAPPPPPLPSGGGGPPPPPPLPGGIGATTAPLFALSPFMSGKELKKFPNKKLKPFHWHKVPANMVNSSMWKKSADLTDVINTKILDEMFAVSSKDKKVVKEKPSVVRTLLDNSRARNVGIFLRGLQMNGHSPDEIVDKLNFIYEKDGALSLDLVQSLRREQPTPDEMEMYTCYHGDTEHLSAADHFLLQLSTTPNLSLKLDLLMAVLEIPSQFEEISQSVESLELACKELLGSSSFHRVLEYVLAIGNYLNASSKRKTGAYGFLLSDLSKLEDYRGKEKNYTLLTYLVEQLQEKDPQLLGFVTELENVPRCCDVSLDAVLSEAEFMKKDLKTKVKHTADVLTKKNKSAENKQFAKDAKEFVSSYEQKLDTLKETCNKLQKSYKKVLAHFGENPKVPSEELFSGVTHFMTSFRAAAKKQNAKKKNEKDPIKTLGDILNSAIPIMDTLSGDQDEDEEQAW